MPTARVVPVDPSIPRTALQLAEDSCGWDEEQQLEICLKFIESLPEEEQDRFDKMVDEQVDLETYVESGNEEQEDPDVLC